LDGSVSKIEQSKASEANPVSEIDTDALPAPSERKKSPCSKTDTHIDIAKGKRSEAVALPSGRPFETASGLASSGDPQSTVRQMAAQYCATSKGARERLAKAVRLTVPELGEFITGRQSVTAGKLAAIRTAASERAVA
jgi:hypothetical protein